MFVSTWCFDTADLSLTFASNPSRTLDSLTGYGYSCYNGFGPARPVLDTKIKKSVFLAGTTTQADETDWRQTLTDALSEYPIAIFNPKRDDWDSTWREDFSDSRWAEQVEWELEMQDKADIVVVFFHSVSATPVTSLLKLGLCVRSGTAIIYALEGYSKRGNVEAVCRRYKARFVSSEQDLTNAVIERLQQELV